MAITHILVQTQGTGAVTTDPNTLLLMHGEDLYTDSSQYDRNIVVAGMVIDPSGKFGSALKTNGSPGYAQIEDSADWAFGTGDFTIEMFVNFADVDAQNNVLYGQSADVNPGSNRIILSYNGSNDTVYFIYSRDSGAISFTATFGWLPTSNTWYHIAVQRSAGTTSAFIDGISQTLTKTGTEGMDIPDFSNAPVTIGANYNGGGVLIGEVNNKFDEVRISNVARYSGNFTAPTAPFIP